MGKFVVVVEVEVGVVVEVEVGVGVVVEVVVGVEVEVVVGVEVEVEVGVIQKSLARQTPVARPGTISGRNRK
jgi:hypothetical protein